MIQSLTAPVEHQEYGYHKGRGGISSRTARGRQLAVNLAGQTQGHSHLMRQDQARPVNKRLFCSLDLEIENLLRQERTLLYSIRHSRTSRQFSFARRIQHYLDSGYSAVNSIAGLWGRSAPGTGHQQWCIMP